MGERDRRPRRRGRALLGLLDELSLLPVLLEESLYVDLEWLLHLEVLRLLDGERLECDEKHEELDVDEEDVVDVDLEQDALRERVDELLDLCLCDLSLL